jgi:hypothetical protein
MPHAGRVKREFAPLHLAIVPDGAPTRGQSEAAMFI